MTPDDGGADPRVARIVLEPDEVNQDERVTLTDGTVVDLEDAGAGVLDRIARQLHVHRSTYAHALRVEDPDLAEAVVAGDEALDDVAPLYRRVAALRAQRGRERAGRAAEELDLTMLLQTRTWTSASGVTRPLSELTPSHRRNLRGWLERNSELLRGRVAASDLDDGDVEDADPWVAGTPLYRRLGALIAAESPREQAIDEARQAARAAEFDRSGRWPER